MSDNKYFHFRPFPDEASKLIFFRSPKKSFLELDLAFSPNYGFYLKIRLSLLSPYSPLTSCTTSKNLQVDSEKSAQRRTYRIS